MLEMNATKERFVWIGKRIDNDDIIMGSLIECSDEKYIIPFKDIADNLDYDGNLETVTLIRVCDEVALFDRRKDGTQDELITFLKSMKQSFEQKIDKLISYLY